MAGHVGRLDAQTDRVMPETTVTRPEATVAVDRLTLSTAEVRAADLSIN